MGTLLAVGEAGLGAGGRFARDGFRLMAQGGYDLLSFQNGAAAGALLAVGEAGLRTGGRFARDGFRLMAQGGYGLLRRQDLAAASAGDAVGEAGFRAGGRLAGYRLGIMAQGPRFLRVFFAAERTFPGLLAPLRAGGLLVLDHLPVVPMCVALRWRGIGLAGQDRQQQQRDQQQGNESFHVSHLVPSFSP